MRLAVDRAVDQGYGSNLEGSMQLRDRMWLISGVESPDVHAETRTKQ
jgi:hypothetical protein